MSITLQLRRDTTANWGAKVLAQGEPAYDTSTGAFKIGDGSTAFSSLPGLSATPAWSSITGKPTITAFAETILDDANAASVRTTIGLGNVDNTSDASKPVSTAQATAIGLKLDASAVSAFGLTLIDDANAATARTTLGLGSAATSASTDFAAASRPTGWHVPVTLASGQFVSQQINAIAPTTAAMAADRLDCQLFVPARDVTIDQISVEVTTIHAANNCRIGIYADNNGAPGSLLVGGVTNHDVGTTGVKAETVSLAMTAGTRYWVAVHSSGATAQFRSNPTTGALIFGTANGGASAGFTTWRGTPAYASGLPNPPTSMTRTGGAIMPLVYLRVA